ncbi:hypothetical protein BDQ17DRAFT_1341250 [Cyathus striatus]|nr:hypothetical protein BDQ17DRAFT_1341250 [Cyathus striatus]
MTNTSKNGSLAFLAELATSAETKRPVYESSNAQFDTRTSVFSECRSRACWPTLGDLHISFPGSSSVTGTQSGPLRHSNSSNHITRAEPSAATANHYNTRSSKKKPRKASPITHIRSSPQLKTKRKELMDRAIKIPSLDNSPANDRQLLVLRMVYDEITMYPSEAWMVLVAVIIRRAFKQVKNWFSNERQKNKVGEVVSIQTEDGERLRIRPEALAVCEQWSDQFFEEVVMVHNFKILRQMRWEADRAAGTLTGAMLRF